METFQSVILYQFDLEPVEFINFKIDSFVCNFKGCEECIT